MAHDELLAEVRDKLKTRVSATAPPALSDQELDEILEETANAVVWSAAAVYEYGQRIMPTDRTYGLVATVRVGGTSGATEPTWSQVRYGSVSDGVGDLLYTMEAPDFGSIWNMERATYRAWVLKASKAAEMYGVSEDGQSFNLQHVHDHCLKMARQSIPMGVA